MNNQWQTTSKGGLGDFYVQDDLVGEVGKSFYPFKRGPGAIPGEAVGVGFSAYLKTVQRW